MDYYNNNTRGVPCYRQRSFRTKRRRASRYTRMPLSGYYNPLPTIMEDINENQSIDTEPVGNIVASGSVEHDESRVSLPESQRDPCYYYYSSILTESRRANWYTQIPVTKGHKLPAIMEEVAEHQEINNTPPAVIVASGGEDHDGDDDEDDESREPLLGSIDDNNNYAIDEARLANEDENPPGCLRRLLNLICCCNIFSCNKCSEERDNL